MKTIYYTWNDLPLDNFVRLQEGDDDALLKSGKKDGRFDNLFFAIQDEYINAMGGDTAEIKRYKKVVYDYTIALQKWVLNPKTNTMLYIEVNRLFEQKNKLAKEIFKDGKTDWDVLIVNASRSIGFYIDRKKWLAKEFIKLGKNGRKTNK